MGLHLHFCIQHPSSTSAFHVGVLAPFPGHYKPLARQRHKSEGCEAQNIVNGVSLLTSGLA